MYIIQEMQTSNNQTALVPAVIFSNRNEAESNYHMKLSAAAISDVEVHTVIMYDEHGNTVKRDYYEHVNEE